MQLLYQLDLRGLQDVTLIRENLPDGPDGPAVCDAAYELAMAAWGCHGEADRLASELAPQWPTHRQPAVDRAILRLAYHELVSGQLPVGIVINEAVELAKRFAGEHSGAFVNGVLDQMARKLAEGAPSDAAID